MTPEPKPGILDISPYVGGRATLAGVSEVIKLSSNESPFGPGPNALEALARAAHGAGIYPEGSASMLREAIADVYGLDPARIVASGDGSDSILTMLANAYLREGDEALFAENSFMVYKIATLANSAVPVEAPQKNRAVDVEALLARVTPRTKLVFVANPDNPTGSYISSAEMARLHAGLPKTALLVIDAAYSEYVMKQDYDPGTALVTANKNVVMTRTFSKIHGLAGLRIGWCYAPEAVCDVLNRIRGPFNVAVLQQYVGAAAIRDTAHVEKSAAHNEQWKNWLIDEIRKTGLAVDDSVANFILIHFPKKLGHNSGDKSAAAADAFLGQRGLILRALTNYGFPDALRLTIGSEDANRKVAAAIRYFMEQ